MAPRSPAAAKRAGGRRRGWGVAVVVAILIALRDTPARFSVKTLYNRLAEYRAAEAGRP